MPNNKKKSLRKITVKQAGVHPYSRKATQMNRAIERTSRLESKRRSRPPSDPRVDRMLWFKYAMDPDVSCYTDLGPIHELIQMYIERNQEELQEMRKLHRKGQSRPKASREDMFIALMEKDNLEYTSGFEMPDLLDKNNVSILREWKGDVNNIYDIKTTRITRSSILTEEDCPMK